MDIENQFLPRWVKTDYLLVAMVGFICLIISYTFLYRGASLSDEIVYTVVARNLFEQQTLNTNIYRTDTIVRQGYPTRDYHMPGLMITLAAVFVLFGINEVTVGLPSQVAYLLAGLSFYRIGKTLFKPAIAFWATLLFYIYPVSFASANLVMVESVLHLVVVIYLAYWIKLSQMETLRMIEVILLAVILIVGMIFRETFVIFLFPALFILAGSALKRRHYQPLLVFSLVFGLLFITVFWPLSQNRAYYPLGLNNVLAAETWPAKFEIAKASLLKNISLIPLLNGHYSYAAGLNLILGILITLVGVRFLYATHKWLVILCIYLFWSMFALLTVLHAHILEWLMSRHMYAFLFPGLLLLIGAIFKIKSSYFRYTTLVITTCLVGLISFQTVKDIISDQDKTTLYYQKTSALITNYLKSYQPQTIMFNQAFGAARDHYPLVLIWSLPSNYKEMQLLEKRLLIDAIVVDSEQHRDIILEAGAIGLLKQRYILLFPDKIEGYYFLIRENLQFQEGSLSP